MNAAFDALGLVHLPVKTSVTRNTNREKGFSETCVTSEDIRLFERFLDRLPKTILDQIGYLKNYDPWVFHQPEIIHEA